jgi:outer membrane protein OmpA-like peptidoglycan-associated protein
MASNSINGFSVNWFLGKSVLRGSARSVGILAIGVLALGIFSPAAAQERFPEDRPTFSYHTGPAYRDSESHPLRVAAYILHPIGWLAQEAIFRPMSYFMSSSDTTRKVFGYHDPFDFRRPECYSSNSATPNCRLYPPFNYAPSAGGTSILGGEAGIASPSSGESVGAYSESSAQAAELGARQVYLPDVNFNFNSHNLTPLGEGRVRQIAQLLNKEAGLTIVLEGNADQVGSDAYNEKLGLNRAESVRSKLVELGVSADRLSTVSFGKSKPVFAEDAEWARAVNRRVEAQAAK